MARIKGSSKTEEIRSQSHIISYMTNPVGTLFAIWHGSRYPDKVSPSIIQAIYDHSELEYGSPYPEISTYLEESYPEYASKGARGVIEEVCKLVLKSNLPPADAIQFVIEIDDATVAWRDQLVRGRLPQSFWTQTSRTADLTCMDVAMSPNISKYGGDEAVNIYKDTVDTIRRAYKLLSDLGVPTEDIRLSPGSMTHRVYWTVSVRVLISTLAHRTSWIAQASLWSPIIEDIISELKIISPFFGEYFGEPHDAVISDGKVISHSYVNENDDRYYGKDPQPCDPLYLAFTGRKLPSHTDMKMYQTMKESYIKLWNDQTLEVLGWDRNDPKKPGYYDIPESN